MELNPPAVAERTTTAHPLNRSTLSKTRNAIRTVEVFVAERTSFNPAATLFKPAVSPAPRCAPGCITRNGNPNWPAS